MIKRYLFSFSVALLFFLAACAGPAIRSDLLKSGQRNPSLQALSDAPGPYVGRLFVLGGEILGARVTDKGSVIEAIDITVNADGVPEAGLAASGRFLAIQDMAGGILDPAVYKEGRYITVAGYFTGVSKQKGSGHVLAVFRIAQIRLWGKRAPSTTPPPAYNPYYGPFYHNPSGPNPYVPNYGPGYSPHFQLP